MIINKLAALLLPILAGSPPRLESPGRPESPTRPGSPARRDERGLSQSTENAILLVGAVAVATIVITAVTKYVQGHLPA